MSSNNISLVLVKGQPLQTDDLEVLRPDQAIVAMNSVIARAKVITKVKDAKTHNQAGLIGGELKGLMKGLRANYDAAKAPLLAIQRALDNLFNELYKPLEEQYQRMDQVVSAFTDGLRREKEMEEAKAKAEADRKEAEAKARIAELERQR